jgi:Skp family chaperone for outer membrane proteins
METTFLKVLTEKQAEELRAMAAELKTLAAKLQSFRLTEGDNRGCAEEAAGFALAAGQSCEELISRATPRAAGFRARRKFHA